jgi:hypothetical protein
VTAGKKLDVPVGAVFEGIYTKWALWHGLVDGWPALNLTLQGDDMTWERGSSVSKIRKVVGAIDAHLGFPISKTREHFSRDEISAAYSYILDTFYAKNVTFKQYYVSLCALEQGSGVTPVSGWKRRRSAESDLTPPARSLAAM